MLWPGVCLTVISRCSIGTLERIKLAFDKKAYRLRHIRNYNISNISSDTNFEYKLFFWFVVTSTGNSQLLPV